MRVCSYSKTVSGTDNSPDNNNVLFLVNEGKSLNEILKDVKDVTTDIDQLKVRKYHAIKAFVDCVINLNKEYIHMDLKSENIVYNYKNDVLKAVLIDLDDMVEKKTLCHDSEDYCKFKTIFTMETVPFEYLHYTHLGNKNETIVKDLFGNLKINYVGIMAVIFEIILEIKWTDFIHKLCDDIIQKYTNNQIKYIINNYLNMYFEDEKVYYMIYIYMFINYSKIKNGADPKFTINLGTINKNIINLVKENQDIYNHLKNEYYEDEDDIINMKTIMNNFENTISEIIVDAMKSSPQINNIDQEQLVNLIINMLCADINVRPEPEDIYINVQKILTIQGI